VPGLPAAAVRASARPLAELALLFLRLGATAFGGPAAHIALMEDEVVRRRGWLTQEEFLDLLGATNLIPGPNSTEMAIHIGHRRAGWRGLVVAGVCFILPAALMVGALAWGYVRFGGLPQVAAVLYGVKPVIIAVVLQALLALGRTAIRSVPLALLAVAAALGAVSGVHEIALLLAAGVAALAMRLAGGQPGARRAALAPVALATASALPAAASAMPAAVPLGALFLAFLKIGSVLFGSGYVLFAFLRADLVERLGWLTETQLVDAVAVGQITPGPLFTAATFVGYLVRGAPGALVATVAIFLPAFLFVAASGPLVPRLRRSPLAGAFLDGVNVASLALMSVVAWHLARASVVDVPTLALLAAAAVALLLFRLPSLWMVLAGALAGIAIRAAQG
jgi:chromate transporter